MLLLWILALAKLVLWIFVSGGPFDGESEQTDFYKDTASIHLLFPSLLQAR